MNPQHLQASKTAFIICGALAREVVAIIDRHQWAVDVFGIKAIAHMYPAQIAQAVEARYLAIRDVYDRVLVVYGDCGTRGVLDEVLDKYGLDRLKGPHCYEMYAGQLLDELLEQEPGTFFLTDFLVRSFQGTVWRGLGLNRFPELKDEYFRNYRRVVYLSQVEDPQMQEKAGEIAAVLGLPMEIIKTGYGPFEGQLVEFMGKPVN